MGSSRAPQPGSSRASESSPVAQGCGRRPRLLAVAWLGALGLTGLAGLTASPARAVVFTVGADGACSASTLAIALLLASANGPGHDEIRLTANQVGNFSIHSQSVSIVGGFATCSAASATGISVISGPGTGRVFMIYGATNALLVELVNLDVTGGTALNGGGLYISDSFVVALYNTWVYGNHADSGGGGVGGGIAMVGDGGARLAIDQNSNIHDNDAVVGGGGIYCQETVPATAGVTLLDGRVESNSAVSYGGGIAVRGCDLISYTGGPQRGIRSNTTPGIGGGVYADTGAQVELWGDSVAPATLDANSATAGGSALYVWGPNVTAALHNSWVTNHPNGPAFVARDGGRIFMDRTLGGDCHDAVNCSLVAGNHGGIVIGDLSLSHTVVEDNTASAALLLLQTDSAITLDGVLFARNILSGGAGARVLQFNGNSLHVTRTTFVDNLVAGQYLVWLACGGCYPPPQTLQMDNTLVAEAAGEILAPDFVPANYALAFDCVILPEVASIPPSAVLTRFSGSANPTLHFVNRPAGDFHLRLGSPAIDFCSAPAGFPVDMDAQAYGFDEPTAFNFFGIWDLGADEATPGLFSDGFQTGNTGRWSAALP